MDRLCVPDQDTIQREKGPSRWAGPENTADYYRPEPFASRLGNGTICSSVARASPHARDREASCNSLLVVLESSVLPGSAAKTSTVLRTASRSQNRVDLSGAQETIHPRGQEPDPGYLKSLLLLSCTIRPCVPSIRTPEAVKCYTRLARRTGLIAIPIESSSPVRVAPLIYLMDRWLFSDVGIHRRKPAST